MFTLVSTNAATQTIDFTCTTETGAQSGTVQAKRAGSRSVLFSHSLVMFLILSVLGVSEKTAISRIKAQGLGEALSEEFHSEDTSAALIKAASRRKLGTLWVMSKNKLTPFTECECVLMAAFGFAFENMLKAAAAAKKAEKAAQAQAQNTDTEATTPKAQPRTTVEKAGDFTITRGAGCTVFTLDGMLGRDRTPAPEAQAPCPESAQTTETTQTTQTPEAPKTEVTTPTPASAPAAHPSSTATKSREFMTIYTPRKSMADLFAQQLSAIAAAKASRSKDSQGAHAAAPASDCQDSPDLWAPDDSEVGFIAEADGGVSRFSDYEELRAAVAQTDPEYEPPRGCGPAIPPGTIEGPCYESRDALERDAGRSLAYLDPELTSAYKSHKHAVCLERSPQSTDPQPSCGSAFGDADDEPFWQHIFCC